MLRFLDHFVDHASPEDKPGAEDPDDDGSDDDDEDQAFKDGSWKDNIDTEGFWPAVEWKYGRLRKVLHPEPGEAYSYEEWKAGKSEKKHRGGFGRYERDNLRHQYSQIRLEDEFKDQGLQVIVKMAGVELTPEKPEYAGGSWHLEVSDI